MEAVRGRGRARPPARRSRRGLRRRRTALAPRATVPAAPRELREPRGRGKFVVGLTGGIGTGKSAALAEFRRAGAATIDLDALARELSRPGGAAYRALARSLGRRWFDASGRLDRRGLAEAAFGDPRLRRRLERAVHPPVLRRMRRLIARARRSVVVADAPLLFEAGLQDDFDATLVVSASGRLALRRALRRGGLGRNQILARRRAQWPLRRKTALADAVIANDGSPAELRASVREYFRAFDLIAGSLGAPRPHALSRARN